MALTDAQTQTVHEACGLFAGGGTRYRYRFNAFSTQDIASSSLSWSYADVKTRIDTRLAALTSGEETRLGTYITTYDDTATSSFKMRGGSRGVVLDDEAENEKAARRIRQIVGIWVEPVQPDAYSGGAQERVVR